jgi:hypothetical protein
MHHGAIPLQDMPESLQGRDIKFSFYSPLSDATDQAEAAIWADGTDAYSCSRLLQVDPAQACENVNMTKSVRGALKAAGWKADWFNP